MTQTNKTDNKQDTEVRERPLGPFSNIICLAKGHEWQDSGFIIYGYECKRCWKLSKNIPIKDKRELE